MVTATASPPSPKPSPPMWPMPAPNSRRPRRLSLIARRAIRPAWPTCATPINRKRGCWLNWARGCDRADQGRWELQVRLYVTGGTGLVGSNVIRLARQRGCEIIASQYGPPPEWTVDYQLDPLDFADHAAIRASILRYKPDAVIHCAAILDQLFMDSQRELCWSIMVAGTRALAEACREVDARAGVRLVRLGLRWPRRLGGRIVAALPGQFLRRDEAGDRARAERHGWLALWRWAAGWRLWLELCRPVIDAPRQRIGLRFLGLRHSPAGARSAGRGLDRAQGQ